MRKTPEPFFWSRNVTQAVRLGLNPSQLRLAKEQYHAQRKLAKKRGIEWCFDFEQWVNWWRTHLGDDWQLLRGKTRDSFCMARNGDIGPYHPVNVKCRTLAQNRADSAVYGTNGSRNNLGINNPRTNLTNEQVVEIFHAVGSLSSIGKKYGISLSAVWSIKHKKSWVHVIGGL